MVLKCSIPFSEVSLEDQIENVRNFLRREVDTRLRATVPKTTMVEHDCSECGQPYKISERRAKEQTRCDECRFPLRFIPTPEELVWVEQQPPEIKGAVEALLATF